MKNKIIAVTGGIGSGKSTAMAILKSEGFPTLSCDQIVSELYQKRKVKKLLKRIFPTAVSGIINLKIDRKEISRLAFASEILHEKLTSTITPLVLEQVFIKSKKLSGTIFVEVPLLFECNYQNQFDAVLVITRNKRERIESVKLRSSLSEQQILSRMAKQFDYDNSDLSSYTVINNDGNTEQLKEKVVSFAIGYK